MIHLESHLAFTCRCSKVGAVSGRGVVRTGSVRKDERRRFFFFFPQAQTKTLLTQQAPDVYTQPGFRGIQAPCSRDTATARFLSHPSTTAVIITPTKRLERAHPDYSRTPSEGFCTESGCHGDGVSHSHVWDRRSRFMGGARWAQWCSVCHHTDFQ